MMIESYIFVYCGLLVMAVLLFAQWNLLLTCFDASRLALRDICFVLFLLPFFSSHLFKKFLCDFHNMSFMDVAIQVSEDQD